MKEKGPIKRWECALCSNCVHSPDMVRALMNLRQSCPGNPTAFDDARENWFSTIDPLLNSSQIEEGSDMPSNIAGSSLPCVPILLGSGAGGTTDIGWDADQDSRNN